MERKQQGNRLNQRRRFVFETSSLQLKVFAAISMVCYTFSMSIMQNGVIGVERMGIPALSEALATNSDLMVTAGWTLALQLAGGLAVPVYAFLLVEGFCRTSDYRRYLLTILLFAVISEVPYDLAISGVFWDMTGQNALWTMLISLIMLYGLRFFQDRKGLSVWLGRIVLVLAAVLWTTLLRTGFGTCTVLLVATYYVLYDSKGLRILIGVAISTMYVTGPISGYPLYAYNSERGWKGRPGLKYVFYIFYPLHLLILGLIARLIAG